MLPAYRAGAFEGNELFARFGDVFTRLEQSWVRSPRGSGPAAYSYAVLRRLKRARLRGDPRRLLESVLWMWDRVSLVKLLTDAGFDEPRVVDAGESGIPGWDRYAFDWTRDGRPLEPSVYVEARRSPD
jgi:hypothetical protein